MTIALKPPLVIVTDDDFVRVSRNNPGYRFEREEDGTVLVSPTHTKGGAKSGEAFGQLRDFKKSAGGNAYDSNTGFAIGPGKRVYSPDASWVSSDTISALEASRNDCNFWPVSPTVVIEVASDTDAFQDVIEKLDRYIKRGSVYAVAIDPKTREIVERGTPPDGLTLDFNAIIDA